MIKILHTSDIHLGAKVSFLGSRASKYRQKLLETFESIYDKAVEEQVNLVIIAGDLLDSPFPSKTDTEIAKGVFKKLAEAGIYVAILPGNHDYLTDGCVYVVDDLSQGNSRIKVFNDPEENIFYIEELDLGLYVKVNSSPKGIQSPLYIGGQDPLPEREGDMNPKYKVAIAHGSVEINNQPAQNYPIKSEDIKNSGYNYVALGDWHSFLDVSSGEVVAVYPGCLEPLASDQDGAGSIVIAEISEDTTTVRTIPIGYFRIVRADIDVHKVESIIESIRQELDKAVKTYQVTQDRVLLNVQFSGQRELSLNIETDQILEYFESKVFYLGLKDNTSLKIEPRELEKYPNYTIIGKYVKYLLSQKDIDRYLVDEALQKGIRMLENPS